MKTDLVTLKVNDKPVQLKPFVEEFIAGAVLGMLKSLKGCEKIEKVELNILPKKS